jgi:hypothetical protein
LREQILVPGWNPAANSTKAVVLLIQPGEIQWESNRSSSGSS